MQKVFMEWQCRIAPSLGGGFAGTPNEVWGTKDYENDTDPTVFFGLYGLPDFYTLWRHKGRKCVLWAGSDIRHFRDGYWLDKLGRIRLRRQPLAQWLNTHCIHYVENEVEQRALKECGIDSKIVPSFLGNIDDYEIEYEHADIPELYTSVSGDNFQLYGWDWIEMFAGDYEIIFHLFGNTTEWKTRHQNVVVHGRMEQEEMNDKIRKMQGAIRLTKFDGFSEIIAKSVLWGQYPVSFIEYPHMLGINDLDKIKDMKTPNKKGRKYYRDILNKYPWANV